MKKAAFAGMVLASSLTSFGVSFTVGRATAVSVSVPAEDFVNRDIAALTRAADDFDAQATARGINLLDKGYRVELRLIKERP